MAKHTPFVLGMQSLPGQWDDIKDDVFGPDPTPEEKDPEAGKNMVVKLVDMLSGTKKPQLKGITHQGGDTY